MIVVDVNVLAQFVIAGPRTAAAQLVRKKDRLRITPGLTRYELLSALSKYTDQDILAREEAVKIYNRALRCVTIDQANPDPVKILTLHAQSGCTS